MEQSKAFFACKFMLCIAVSSKPLLYQFLPYLEGFAGILTCPLFNLLLDVKLRQSSFKSLCVNINVEFYECKHPNEQTCKDKKT